MEGTFLSRENGTLGRSLIVSPKVAMLEENVGSMFRLQKGIVSHKPTHSIVQPVNSCKSPPPRAGQVLNIHPNS